MRRDPGVLHCHYQTQVTRAVAALHSGDKARISRELERQLEVRRAYLAQQPSPKRQRQCSNDTAALVAETAMSWHLEAYGSGGVRGTRDPATMDHAAALYDRLVENFTSSEFAKFEFPRILREDWPTLYRIKYARADLLYFRKRWRDCGSAFAAVVDEDPSGPESAEAAYASALCYQKFDSEQHAGKGPTRAPTGGPDGDARADRWARLQPKALSPSQQAMIRAFDRYLCVVTPPEQGEVADQYVEIKYARARAYFEAQHWEEAALAFRDVAFQHSKHDAAIFAAHLYLEALNVLRNHADPPRSDCVRAIEADVPRLTKRLCLAGIEEHAEGCARFTQIECDVRRLRAEELVSEADSGRSADPRSGYEAAAEVYRDLWQRFGAAAIAEGEAPRCERMDEILHNGARAYQAANLLAKAMRVRLLLIDPKHGLHETAVARQATFELAQNYQAIAVYDRAAEFFERYARDTKYQGEYSDVALQDAVVLRLGLAQPEQAIADARAFSRDLGRRHPVQAARIALAVAAHYADRGNFRAAVEQLSRSRVAIERHAELDVKVQAYALIGRAESELGHARLAAGAYERVRRLWADAAAAEASLRKAESDGAASDRRLGRALTAVGEAYFFFAEQKRAQAERLKFPEYRGPRTRAGVLGHINSQVAAWIGAKRPLLEDATAAYERIVALKPVPPPRWVIAAGARVGRLWGDFVEEFRSAPLPDTVKTDPELRAVYEAAVARASEPQKLFARRAFETCLSYSVRYQYFDEHSRSCEQWLSETYPSEYHLLDEFRGAPSRRNNVQAEYAPALRIGGQPI